MSKHRRKFHRRKAVITVVALAAVGVPSVAVACVDSGYAQADTYRSHHHWKHHSHKGATWRGAKPATSPSPTATSSPSATPAPAASSPAAGTSNSATARVVQLVNSERAKAGCAPLTVNAKLTKAAQGHSADMAAHRTMSHTGSDGSSPGDRITAAGYSWSAYGENIAYGYTTPESVMAGWMSSPGHKRNILDCGYKEIGVGLAQPGSYWTQDFGTPR